jgi:hypothetical protein
MATICCTPVAKLTSGLVTSMLTLNRRSSSAARRLISRQLI